MIDLHCHLLPGVDDGSRSVDQSVGVLETMAADGVTAVCLTPHLTARRAVDGVPANHDEAYRLLVASAPPRVRLVRGVELMMDRPLAREAAENRALTLGGTRYLLIEFTRMTTAQAVGGAIAHLRGYGLVPVVAHPERYVTATVAVGTWWREQGAVLQLDAMTLIQPTRRGERARALLAAGQADLLAADNHGDQLRTLAMPHRWLSEAGGEGVIVADLLTTVNPARILDDAPLDPVPACRLRTSLLAKLRVWFEADA